MFEKQFHPHLQQFWNQNILYYNYNKYNKYNKYNNYKKKCIIYK